MTAAHEQRHTITEVISYPDHADRTESLEFAQNKRQMVKKMDLPCWICGSRDKREVHHIHEWSLWAALDQEKVLDTLHAFDPYGLTHQMGDKPILSPDDIRNLVVLCGEHVIEGETIAGGHHRGINLGVHNITFAVWIALRSMRAGVNITHAISHVTATDKALSEQIHNRGKSAHKGVSEA